MNQFQRTNSSYTSSTNSLRSTPSYVQAPSGYSSQTGGLQRTTSYSIAAPGFPQQQHSQQQHSISTIANASLYSGYSKPVHHVNPVFSNQYSLGSNNLSRTTSTIYNTPSPGSSFFQSKPSTAQIQVTSSSATLSSGTVTSQLQPQTSAGTAQTLSASKSNIQQTDSASLTTSQIQQSTPESLSASQPTVLTTGSATLGSSQHKEEVTRGLTKSKSTFHPSTTTTTTPASPRLVTHISPVKPAAGLSPSKTVAGSPVRTNVIVAQPVSPLARSTVIIQAAATVTLSPQAAGPSKLHHDVHTSSIAGTSGNKTTRVTGLPPRPPLSRTQSQIKTGSQLPSLADLRKVQPKAALSADKLASATLQGSTSTVPTSPLRIISQPQVIQSPIRVMSATVVPSPSKTTSAGTLILSSSPARKQIVTTTVPLNTTQFTTTHFSAERKEPEIDTDELYKRIRGIEKNFKEDLKTLVYDNHFNHGRPENYRDSLKKYQEMKMVLNILYADYIDTLKTVAERYKFPLDVLLEKKQCKLVASTTLEADELKRALMYYPSDIVDLGNARDEFRAKIKRAYATLCMGMCSALNKNMIKTTQKLDVKVAEAIAIANMGVIDDMQKELYTALETIKTRNEKLKKLVKTPQ